MLSKLKSLFPAWRRPTLDIFPADELPDLVLTFTFKELNDRDRDACSLVSTRWRALIERCVGTTIHVGHQQVTRVLHPLFNPIDLWVASMAVKQEKQLLETVRRLHLPGDADAQQFLKLERVSPLLRGVRNFQKMADRKTPEEFRDLEGLLWKGAHTAYLGYLIGNSRNPPRFLYPHLLKNLYLNERVSTPFFMSLTDGLRNLELLEMRMEAVYWLNLQALNLSRFPKLKHLRLWTHEVNETSSVDATVAEYIARLSRFGAKLDTILQQSFLPNLRVFHFDYPNVYNNARLLPFTTILLDFIGRHRNTLKELEIRGFNRLLDLDQFANVQGLVVAARAVSDTVTLNHLSLEFNCEEYWETLVPIWRAFLERQRQLRSVALTTTSRMYFRQLQARFGPRSNFRSTYPLTFFHSALQSASTLKTLTLDAVSDWAFNGEVGQVRRSLDLTPLRRCIQLQYLCIVGPVERFTGPVGVIVSGFSSLSESLRVLRLSHCSATISDLLNLRKQRPNLVNLYELYLFRLEWIQGRDGIGESCFSISTWFLERLEQGGLGSSYRDIHPAVDKDLAKEYHAKKPREWKILRRYL